MSHRIDPWDALWRAAADVLRNVRPRPLTNVHATIRKADMKAIAHFDPPLAGIVSVEITPTMNGTGNAPVTVTDFTPVNGKVSAPVVAGLKAADTLNLVFVETSVTGLKSDPQSFDYTVDSKPQPLTGVAVTFEDE